MFEQLLPQRIDNAYRGYKGGLWIFGLLMLMRGVISVNSLIHTRTIATSADGIPLDTFSSAGAQTAVSLFALLALSRLVVCLLGVLALVRYRSMVPLLFAVLLVEYLGKTLVLRFLPIPRAGTPPGNVVNLVLLVLMVAGLAFSIRFRAPAES